MDDIIESYFPQIQPFFFKVHYCNNEHPLWGNLEGNKKYCWWYKKQETLNLSTTNKFLQTSVISCCRKESHLNIKWPNFSGGEKLLVYTYAVSEKGSFNNYSLFDFTQHIKTFDIFAWLETIIYKTPNCKRKLSLNATQIKASYTKWWFLYSP